MRGFYLVFAVDADLLCRYASILKRLESCVNDAQKLRLKHILGWLAFSYRPLKSWELCDAIVFQDNKSSLDASTRLGKGILDICKPLIEERADCTVALVHFSLRECDAPESAPVV